MDLGDIRRVVQYMIPKTLTQYTQHAGRCGRDGKPALAILLVEPTVFQRIRRKNLSNAKAMQEEITEDLHREIDVEGHVSD
jgi:superfamily II DNA helicase RecQ